VAGRKYYQCANKPGSNLRGLIDYACPFWNKKDNPGMFDESGYEIDHIEEQSIGGSDNIENLQALCLCCHRVKTIRFNSENDKNK